MTITGNATQNQTLIARNALADADGSFGYQWHSLTDGSTRNAIAGATASTLVLTEAQVGKAITVTASHIDGHGIGESVTSIATVVDASDNHAPTVVTAIADQLATADDAFAFTVPANAFSDSDAGDVLSFTATLADGAVLPKWLAFDRATRTFSGTLPSYSAGQFNVRVTATDPAGLSVSDDFVLDVANHIVGTTAANTIVGTALRDVIEGLAGNDTLSGGAGDDIFKITGTGDGYDTFQGDAGFDMILGSDSDDVIGIVYSFSGAATVERIDGGAGVNSISGSYYANTLDFSATELVNIAAIDGGQGNDAIIGSAGDDVIMGGAGSDRLSGGLGNDRYRIALGDGADTVVENDASAGNSDVAEFMTGIAADQIWLRHVGNNLEASIIGTADKLSFENWYSGAACHVEQFVTADGKVLQDSRVEYLVQAMAAFAPPAAGQTSLPPSYQDALAPVIAANWQ